MSAELTEVHGGSDNRTMSTPPILPIGPAKIEYSTPFVQVDETPVRFPNGVEGSYARINPGTHGGVAIPRSITRGIARYGLVRQYRHPVARTTLEFPRGGTDDGSEAETVRELVEETGLSIPLGGGFRLGTLHADTGLLATDISVWLIPVEDIGNTAFIEAETGASHLWVTEGELFGLISRGELSCGITLGAFMLLKASAHAVAPGTVG